ncbi:MAG: flagellar basal body rod protein FlgB [Acetobacteraceae bacterium]
MSGASGGGIGGAGFAGGGIFGLAAARLSWLDQRQAVLAANVANADTPGWRPRDLQPFAQVLAGAGGLTLTTTNPADIGSPGGAGAAEITVPTPGGVGPDGNAVALDRQISAVANTDNQQQLAVSLYQTYLSMFTTALGSP